MTSTFGPDDDVIAELLKVEEQRCRAIAEQDLATLEPLLAEDLTFTHMNARVHDKAGFLAARAGGPRFRTEQHGLTVRVYGNVAVMTGGQLLDVEGIGPIEAQVSQVWVKHDSSWQQVVFHATQVRT